MKYVIDNCLSPKFAAMLAALGVDALALRDEMPRDAADVEVFEFLKGRSIVFVTCDTRQKTRAAEARALRASGITALFLGPFWTKMTFWQQAAWLVAKWEGINTFCEAVQRGTCADVKQNGKPRIFQL